MHLVVQFLVGYKFISGIFSLHSCRLTCILKNRNLVAQPNLDNISHYNACLYDV